MRQLMLIKIVNLLVLTYALNKLVGICNQIMTFTTCNWQPNN